MANSLDKYLASLSGPPSRDELMFLDDEDLAEQARAQEEQRLNDARRQLMRQDEERLREQLEAKKRMQEHLEKEMKDKNRQQVEHQLKTHSSSSTSQAIGDQDQQGVADDQGQGQSPQQPQHGQSPVANEQGQTQETLESGQERDPNQETGTERAEGGQDQGEGVPGMLTREQLDADLQRQIADPAVKPEIDRLAQLEARDREQAKKREKEKSLSFTSIRESYIKLFYLGLPVSTYSILHQLIIFFY